MIDIGRICCSATKRRSLDRQTHHLRALVEQTDKKDANGVFTGPAC
jgi:hypothetical protein